MSDNTCAYCSTYLNSNGHPWIPSRIHLGRDSITATPSAHGHVHWLCEDCHSANYDLITKDYEEGSELWKKEAMKQKKEKSCHYCLGGTKPWYVWRRGPMERGEAKEQLPGLSAGRRHRLCRECHKALLALKRVSREVSEP